MKVTSAESTPYVSVDFETGMIHISGKSTPYDADIFFLPLVEMIKLFDEEKKELTLNFDLEYADDASCKCIAGVMQTLEELRYTGLNAHVIWNYELASVGKRIKKLGDDLSRRYAVDFTFSNNNSPSIIESKAS